MFTAEDHPPASLIAEAHQKITHSKMEGLVSLYSIIEVAITRDQPDARE